MIHRITEYILQMSDLNESITNLVYNFLFNFLLRSEVVIYKVKRKFDFIIRNS
jgi:hypothetical protein